VLVRRSAYPGATLANTFITVDVGAFTRTVSGADVVVTWVFTMADAAASRFYTVTGHATDGSAATIPWRDRSIALGVTHQPTAGPVSPNAGSAPPGTATTFTATFTATFGDADGAAELDLVRLVFETVGVSYDPQGNTLFVDVAGSRPSCTPGAAGVSIAGGGLTLNCAASTVTSSGTALMVAWVIDFAAPFTHQRLAQFLSADDLRRGGTGFVRAGSFAVDNAPVLSSLTPSSGSQTPGTAQTFRGSYFDGDGLSDLTTVELQLDTGKVFGCFPTGCTFSFQQSVELSYFPASGTISIGTNGAAGKSCPVGAAQTLATNLATLDCAGSSAVTVIRLVGGQFRSFLDVSWRVTPAAAMGGFTYHSFLLATDSLAVRTGPTQLGNWVVNTQPASGVNAPASGASAAGVAQRFVTTCADPDGWHN
jgi:hypothetical protein